MKMSEDNLYTVLVDQGQLKPCPIYLNKDGNKRYNKFAGVNQPMDAPEF